MSWLTPLGFLGLIGLIILILIYILKPNYQQKIISSTFVWKLSLKYRKKKIPISKLRNILLFICQVLVITACAMILARPIIDSDNVKDKEKIVIIDASATMRAVDGYENRFERAVNQVKDFADNVARNEGVISIILAGKESSFIIQRAGAENLLEVYDALDALVDPNDYKCSYGDADIDSAMLLAEDVLIDNPKAEVILYTDTHYIDDGKVTVRDVRGYEEWNAAILDAKAELVENKYAFNLTVATYGSNRDLYLTMEVYGFNGDQYSTQTYESEPIRCESGTPVKVVCSSDEGTAITTGVISEYSYVRFYIGYDDEIIEDNFSYDNEYIIYGGKKPELRIQYASSYPNNFVQSFLFNIRDKLAYRWDIEIDQLKTTQEPEVEGYDLYIFEGTQLPEESPSDGVVWYLNPLENVKNSGFTLTSMANPGNYVIEAGETSVITAGMEFGSFALRQFTVIGNHDGFEELAYVGNYPILLTRNDDDAKVAVMTFSVQYSDATLRLEFPLLLLRMLNYFIPSTLTEYVFEVDEVISLNSRGSALQVDGNGINETFNVFPSKLVLSEPGTYTLKQQAFDGRDVIENFYVRIPSSQSNILQEEDILTNPYIENQTKPEFIDLLVWFAAALVFLLFVEWWLQARELF